MQRREFCTTLAALPLLPFALENTSPPSPADTRPNPIPNELELEDRFPSLIFKNSRLQRYDQNCKIYLENAYTNFAICIIAHELWKQTRDIYPYLGRAWITEGLVTGDLFINNETGNPLSPYFMYRIETISGKTLEFQHGKEGPDYSVGFGHGLGRVLFQTKTDVTRYSPDQITHIRFPMCVPEQFIGGDGHPYGYSQVPLFINVDQNIGGCVIEEYIKVLVQSMRNVHSKI